MRYADRKIEEVLAGVKVKAQAGLLQEMTAIAAKVEARKEAEKVKAELEALQREHERLAELVAQAGAALEKAEAKHAIDERTSTFSHDPRERLAALARAQERRRGVSQDYIRTGMDIKHLTAMHAALTEKMTMPEVPNMRAIWLAMRGADQ